MSVSNTLEEQAIALAASGGDRDDAIATLIRESLGRRVAVVRAKQDLGERPDPDATVVEAISMLEEVLVRGEWT